MTENKNYQQQKTEFLDSLTPDDFRNGGSFNQAETVIDEINKAFHQAVINKKDPEQFIQKAITHLFREDSKAVPQAVKLAKLYLQTKI